MDDELKPDEPPTSTVDVVTENGTVIVTIGGEVDMAAIPALERRVGSALAAQPRHVVVDLAGLRFADSSAIALWVRWALRTPQFELRDPPQFLQLVISSMGLSERLGLER